MLFWSSIPGKITRSYAHTLNISVRRINNYTVKSPSEIGFEIIYMVDDILHYHAALLLQFNFIMCSYT